MSRDVKNYVVGCHVFQHFKCGNGKPSGLLQPLPIPANVWEHLGGFYNWSSAFEWFHCYFVVVDHLSKYGHFGPLKPGFTTTSIATLFAEMVAKHHFFPKSIVSDRDLLFFS